MKILIKQTCIGLNALNNKILGLYINNIMRYLKFLWHSMLASLSFVFAKTARPYIARQHEKQAANDDRVRWRSLSQDTIYSPWLLPFIMSHGPRTNPHAIVGLFGPVTVEQYISISLDDIKTSAKHWTLSLYNHPEFQTLESLNKFSQTEILNRYTRTVAASSGNHTDELYFELPPGDYLLGLRYLHWQEDINLPEVRIDGEHLTHTETLPASLLNEFHEHLFIENSFLYKALNYYVYPMLKYRRWLSQEFVERHYLPVRSPDTIFHYDYLAKGEKLIIETDTETRQLGNIYYCIYNRNSFPIKYGHLDSDNITVTAEQDSLVLIRLCSNTPEAAESWAKNEAIFGQEYLDYKQRVRRWM